MLFTQTSPLDALIMFGFFSLTFVTIIVFRECRPEKHHDSKTITTKMNHNNSLNNQTNNNKDDNGKNKDDDICTSCKNPIVAGMSMSMIPKTITVTSPVCKLCKDLAEEKRKKVNKFCQGIHEDYKLKKDLNDYKFPQCNYI
ncbi:hypothetical protein ABK040_014315 [Willaertia magna]